MDERPRQRKSLRVLMRAGVSLVCLGTACVQEDVDRFLAYELAQDGAYSIVPKAIPSLESARRMKLL